MSDDFKFQQSENEWKAVLTPEQYRILRLGKTEPPYINRFCWDTGKADYSCAGCGTVVFRSEDKFISITGWPSFSGPANTDCVLRVKDRRSWTGSEEVLCSKCGSHLGHVFRKIFSRNRYRFCINSGALKKKTRRH